MLFSRDDINRLTLFKLALEGKFSNGKPKLEEIRRFFVTLGLKDSVTVGHLDYCHVLIRCLFQTDFL